MLILLPLAAFALTFLAILGEDDSPVGAGLAAGGAFLRAAILWGAYVTLTSEILSLLGALSRLGIALAWTVAAVSAGLTGWKRGALERGLARLRGVSIADTFGERALLFGMALFAGILSAVAWFSPPNNVDSLQYHMSRVVHWAQDGSLRHYATAYIPQLVSPIWAETAILHLRQLWGDDRPANLVQWFSMIGSVIGSMTLAGQLGAKKSGNLLAGAFVLSIPLGVLQATSTQNDFAVAFWTVCAAFLVIQAAKGKVSKRFDRLCLGLTLGVGFLTKGTYYVYAPPFLLWYFADSWKRDGFRRMIVGGLTIACIASTLNFGFWARNLTTFGGPYGSSDWLQKFLWIAPPRPSQGAAEGGPVLASLADGGHNDDHKESPRLSSSSLSRPATSAPWEGAGYTPSPARPLPEFLVRLLKTAAFNLVTPSAWANGVVSGALQRFPEVFDKGYLEEWRLVAWNHEDTAPNPLHLVLTLGALGIVLLWGRRGATHIPSRYAFAALGTYLLIPALLTYGPSVFGIRYQLPFFVLAGPLVGFAASWPGPRRGTSALSWFLVLSALPWLLLNNTRPLIGITPWPTRVGSILTTSPTVVLLASRPQLRGTYVKATSLVRESGCTQVGLRIDSHDLEYPFWWLLRSPQSGIRIESIYVIDRLKPLLDPAFHPCAILCTICGDRVRLHGLALEADFEQIDVFMGPGYVVDPDG